MCLLWFGKVYYYLSEIFSNGDLFAPLCDLSHCATYMRLLVVWSKDLIATLLVISITSSYLGSGLVYGAPHSYNVLQFGATGNARIDNSQAFLKAWGALCGDSGVGGIPTLVVPKGKFLLKPLNFQGPCKSRSVHVQIIGNIVAPNSLSAWRGWWSDDGWIVFSDIVGLIVDGQGVIDGQGSIWWNQLDGGTPQYDKPTGLRFHNCNNVQLSGLTIQNSPKNHITINTCNVVTISNIHISAPENSPNTDGINLSDSTQVNIHDSTIATGDDCIAINGGCSNINITKIACGPGHGISVGSLGKNGDYETVQDVHVRGCTFTKTQNGARIKTWPNGSGYAKRISFEQITLVETENPIIIDQYYCNGGKCSSSKPSAVQINNVTFSGFQGSSASEQAIILSCSKVGCTNVVLDHVNITSAKPGMLLTAKCNNVNGRSSFTVPEVPCLSRQ